VLSRSWTGLYGNLKLDSAGKTAYPSAVFPIFAVLRHRRVFLTNIIGEPLFNRVIDVFFGSYDGGPLWQGSSADESILQCLFWCCLAGGSVRA
jgi:hypothetical protein